MKTHNALFAAVLLFLLACDKAEVQPQPTTQQVPIAQKNDALDVQAEIQSLNVFARDSLLPEYLNAEKESCKKQDASDRAIGMASNTKCSGEVVSTDIKKSDSLVRPVYGVVRIRLTVESELVFVVKTYECSLDKQKGKWTVFKEMYSCHSLGQPESVPVESTLPQKR